MHKDAEAERAIRAGRIEVPAKTIERFWSKVNKGAENECWEWRGPGSKIDGRGNFSILGIGMPAPRAAYIITKGPVDDLHVCHSCDHPPCVNPSHLWLGTHSDNIKDAYQKGRLVQERRTHCQKGHAIEGENRLERRKGGYTYNICRICNRAAQQRYRDRQPKNGPGRNRGTKVSSAKLDDAKVRTIKQRLANGVKQARLSEEFGLHQTTVSAIACGKTWTHVVLERGDHQEKSNG